MRNEFFSYIDQKYIGDATDLKNLFMDYLKKVMSTSKKRPKLWAANIADTTTNTSEPQSIVKATKKNLITDAN